MKKSIIPSKNDLISAYNYHCTKCEGLSSRYSGYITLEESSQLELHEQELNKLEKVLNVLYPEWNKN